MIEIEIRNQLTPGSAVGNDTEVSSEGRCFNISSSDGEAWMEHSHSCSTDAGDSSWLADTATMGATGTGCSVAGTITSSELCGGIRSALAQYHSKWNTHVSLSYRGLREQFRNVDQKLKVAKVDCLLYVVDNVTRSSDLEEGE